MSDTTAPVRDPGAATGDLVRAVAAHGLAGSTLHLPDRALSEDAWQALLDRVRAERLAGHLVAAITEGGLPVTADQRAEAADVHAVELGHALRLERRSLEVGDAFETAGIDYRVLKGAAFAHTLYAEPSLRLFGDLDLLVRSEQFDDAAAVLLALGCRRYQPPISDDFDTRFGKGTTFAGSDGVEVDLHRTFSLGFFGLSIDLPALFEDPVHYRVGGRTLPTLARETGFLHACYHAATGHVQRLVPLRDIAEFLLTGDLDQVHVLDQARAWRGEAVVARAVRWTWEAFQLADIVPVSVWARRYDLESWERRALSGHMNPDRSEAVRALTALRAIPGVAAKLAYLRALLLPDQRFLRSRRQGRLGWLWRGRRALRRKGRR